MEASFVADITEGCADLEVMFTNTSSLTAQQFYWDFDDGASASGPDQVHIFKNYTDQTIEYEVVLTVVSADFCEQSYSMIITVHPYLQAAFTFEPAESCHPFEVTFTNNSYGASGYEWDFGNGPVSIAESTFTMPFEHDELIPVIFPISLVVSNTQGCKDKLVRELKVFPKIEAGFTASDTMVCNKSLVSFTNQSTENVRYLWEFGDGGSSSLAEPEHIFENTSYESIAEYMVTLYTESDYLCRDTIQQRITVFPAIKASFAIETVEGCSPFTVNIQNHSQGDSVLRWVFGDGRDTTYLRSFNNSLTHTYYNTGDQPIRFTIELEVENRFGCIDVIQQTITVFPEVIARFSSVTDTEGCHPLPVSFVNESENAHYFHWDLGNGALSGEKELVHTNYFNRSHTRDTLYHSRLIATSVHGCKDTTDMVIQVFPKPEASFNVINSPGCSPYDIEITNYSQGNNLVYAWDFGDTHTSDESGDFFSHRYNHDFGTGPGTYTIELVTTDYTFNTTQGCSNTLSQQVTIYPNITANFSTPITEGCHPLTVNFTNESFGADALIAYSWSYGDGSTSNNSETIHSHVFRNFSHTKTETYTVMLVARNANECMDTVYRQITVYPRPLAFFNIPHIQACASYEINVHNRSVGESLSYHWDMSDNTTYTHSGDHFRHTYHREAGSDPGIFAINLTVTDDTEHQCQSSYSQQITIFPEVMAAFTTENEECHPHEAVFENNSVGADYYYWDFGNGNTAQTRNTHQTFLNYKYTEVENYTTTLIAVSQYGCRSEMQQQITVHPIPNAEFSISELSGCSPFTPEIFNLSDGATAFVWDFENATSQDDDESFHHIWRNLTDKPVSFTVALTASIDFGCYSQAKKMIKVYPEVQADFTADLWEGCAPLGVNFTNNSLLADTYQWDFADGLTSKSKSPYHKFLNDDLSSQTFPVRMVAHSIFGCSDTLFRDITVLATPRASFVAQPYKQAYPNATVISTNLTNPGPWNFQWEMGDGNTYFTQSFDPLAHTYIWNGNDMGSKTYTVALIASNQECKETFTQLITITSPIPEANYNAIQSGCEPFPVNFENTSKYAHSYRWDFADGSFSLDPNPSHLFLDHGVYNVRLIAIGDGGSDTIYKTITVIENPVADFDIVTALVKIPEEPLKLINKSKNGDFYLWDFGDGNTSNEFEPVHYYRQPEIYNISLMVSRGIQPQCHDTLTKKNAVRAVETCTLIFPNAFKPSKTGPSSGHFDMGNPSIEIFHPVYQGIEEYHLQIFNRWGELIFRSDDINIGWDGYHKGQLSKMDVYVWKVTGRCTDGSSIIQAGDVTLYR
jgi:PKD repeat protein